MSALGVEVEEFLANFATAKELGGRRQGFLERARWRNFSRRDGDSSRLFSLSIFTFLHALLQPFASGSLLRPPSLAENTS